MAMILSERNLIEHIRRIATRASSPGLIKGIGDDCAVLGIPASGAWLISADVLVDGIHFNRAWHPPRLLGRKSIAVNLSDIAAMGGVPRFFLLSLSLPSSLSSDWLMQWMDGVREILAEYDCVLIGGDTVSSRELNISVTVIGEKNPSGIVYRNEARPGDTICVSGPLGLSAAGLEILKKSAAQNKPFDETWKILVDAHLDPTPQIRLGQALCKSGFVSAMQDISDGLATDLSHICKESGVGAVIHENRLPGFSLLEQACAAFNLSKRDCMLRGGEDYQLVFTIWQGRDKDLEKFLIQSGNHEVFPIGSIVAGEGVYLEDSTGYRREITFQGYEHLT
jgi:thiamine-monophosphate kinase